jgi:hypothetical protein
MTQSNSRVRVKQDTVGEDGMKFLFSQYQTATLEGFRVTCKSLIEESSGKRTSKDIFIYELDRATSKDVMVTKVTNYLMAGQGLGV